MEEVFAVGQVEGEVGAAWGGVATVHAELAGEAVCSAEVLLQQGDGAVSVQEGDDGEPGEE